VTITIKDIARISGVSISTVSRVMNNSKPVNEEVRKKVMEVIEQTQYSPNANARNLVKNESSLIGVIVPAFNHTVLDEMLFNGIHVVSRMHGYDVLLHLSAGTPETELKSLKLFREIRVDGIIIMSLDLFKGHMEIIETSQIPSILVGQISHPASIPTVHIDNTMASYEAVSYLIQNGHRQIAMIRGKYGDTAVGDHRFLGYQKALSDAGIPLRKDWVVESDFSADEAADAMHRILETGSTPSAVFCATDLMAIGALLHTREIGIRVPEDMSIVGFDGINMSMIIRPKLTTVEYSPAEIGMTATRNLIKMIKGDSILAQHMHVPHRLVIRESTRAL
jgi:LacI family transcriptional regulator